MTDEKTPAQDQNMDGEPSRNESALDTEQEQILYEYQQDASGADSLSAEK